MMPSNPMAAARTIPASADALMATRVRLMAELEASLQCSRKALLALDLTEIERQTAEQADLIRRFDQVLREGRLARGSGEPAEGDAKSVLSVPQPAREEEEEVRRKARRIVEAARLQAALLTRAQCKLRILANIVAGPAVTYGPFQGCGRSLTANSLSAADARN